MRPLCTENSVEHTQSCITIPVSDWSEIRDSYYLSRPVLLIATHTKCTWNLKNQNTNTTTIVVQNGPSNKKHQFRLQPQYLICVPKAVVFLTCSFFQSWLRESDQISYFMFLICSAGKTSVGWRLGLGTLCQTGGWPLCWDSASLKHLCEMTTQSTHLEKYTTSCWIAWRNDRCVIRSTFSGLVSYPLDNLYPIEKPGDVPKMTPGHHSTYRCCTYTVAVVIRCSRSYSCTTQHRYWKLLAPIANVGSQRPSGPAYTRRHR